VLHQTDGWIGGPRFSPDGSRIAFADHPVLGSDHGSIAIVTLDGQRRTLSGGWGTVGGCAWGPSGQEVWFSGLRSMEGGAGVYAVSLDGAERVVLRGTGRVRIHDISPAGDVLMSQFLVRLGIRCVPPGETAERELSWLDWSLLRDMTRDGRFILFDETAFGGGDRHSVYLRGTDGSPAVRLSDGVAAQLSPDGQWAATFNLDRTTEMVLVPTGIGEPRSIRPEGIERILWGVWLPDGQRIAILANEPGHAVRGYILDLEDPRPVPFTAEGQLAWGIIAAPDGRTALGQAPDGSWMRFPIGGGAPEPLPAIRPTERRVLNFSESGEEVYTFERNELLGRIWKVNLATGAREIWRELAPLDRSGVLVQGAAAITRDGAAYAYSYSLTLGTLHLVKGLA
jgi:dipeptidyl aminopeptidase/acylaminoacyl peptidase